MHTNNQVFPIHRVIVILFVLLILGSFPQAEGISALAPQAVYDPTTQTPALLYDEARTVHLGNLARQNNGIPPLRWNRQLTHAARWYSWDSTENRPNGFCGHQDTQGNWPSYRILAFGYLGFGGAENSFCGYVTPQDAINGWMNSPGHRANLLDPNSREIGLGYYRRSSDGRGYVTQDFGNDAIYAPVIVQNEAVSSISPNVDLYIYNRSTSGGFAGLAAATQMMVSNNPYFSGSAWEPYAANKTWVLPGGTGWRNVYVKTRDRFNRTLTVSDAIYLGDLVPLNELGPAQMSTRSGQVTLYDLNGGALPQVQFSLGWMADDTNSTFGRLWGNGERVNDAAALGGTAFRMFPGDGESSSWAWDTTFIKDVPLTAYLRLKVNNNTSSSEVARFVVEGGGINYGPLILRGTDFTAPNQYQEFPLNFAFHANPDHQFLIFQFWRSGAADVYIDVVTIFTRSQAITSPLTLSVPGNNYRGQGVRVRYTNGTQFSAISEGKTLPDPSYTISGNTGAAGTTLSYTVSGTARNVVADSAGAYSFTIPNGWNGTVTASHTCFTFSPSSRNYSNVSVNQSAQNYSATLNPGAGCANVNVLIAGTNRGNFGIPSPGSTRARFQGVNSGPVKIASMNAVSLMGAERVIYRVNGVDTSFSEMMGLPNNQLDHTYWLPWYNNKDLDTQLRFANVSLTQASVRVFIGGVEMPGSPFSIAPGASLRKSFPGIDRGPVQILSNVNIVAAERVIYKVNGVNTSFSEMMALPNNRLDNVYWLPWYNNKDLNTQLRFGNVSNQQASVRVFIGGVEMPGSPFSIAPGASLRKSFPGIDRGPVKIESDQYIIAAERVIYNVNGLDTSFSEMMALPNGQLDTLYWLPWYNNKDLNTQLRFANVSGVNATVHVFIGEQEMDGSPFILAPGASTRKSFPGIDGGPVKIESNVPVVAAERVIYKVNGVNTSFSEMIGLPDNALSLSFWLPWYNNLELNTQLRFGVP